MRVIFTKYLRPFSAYVVDGDVHVGSRGGLTCWIAFENRTPLRYKRGRRVFSGHVVGPPHPDFATVKGDNLKRYRIRATQIEAVKS